MPVRLDMTREMEVVVRVGRGQSRSEMVDGSLSDSRER